MAMNESGFFLQGCAVACIQIVVSLALSFTTSLPSLSAAHKWKVRGSLALERIRVGFSVMECGWNDFQKNDLDYYNIIFVAVLLCWNDWLNVRRQSWIHSGAVNSVTWGLLTASVNPLLCMTSFSLSNVISLWSMDDFKACHHTKIITQTQKNDELRYH